MSRVSVPGTARPLIPLTMTLSFTAKPRLSHSKATPAARPTGVAAMVEQCLGPRRAAFVGRRRVRNAAATSGRKMVGRGAAHSRSGAGCGPRTPRTRHQPQRPAAVEKCKCVLTKRPLVDERLVRATVPAAPAPAHFAFWGNALAARHCANSSIGLSGHAVTHRCLSRIVLSFHVNVQPRPRCEAHWVQKARTLVLVPQLA